MSRSLIFGLLVVGLNHLALGAGNPTAGKSVYQSSRCRNCHQIDDKGGKMGGALDDIGSRHDGPWLRAFIQKPTSKDPEARMKAYPALTDQQLDDLVAYLLTLKKSPPTP